MKKHIRLLAGKMEVARIVGEEIKVKLKSKKIITLTKQTPLELQKIDYLYSRAPRKKEKS